VPDLLRMRSEPIRNPVTDKEHRLLTVLPNGWVFHEAEGAAGFAKSMGQLKFDLRGRHSSMAYVAWGPNGLKYDVDESRWRFQNLEIRSSFPLFARPGVGHGPANCAAACWKAPARPRTYRKNIGAQRIDALALFVGYQAARTHS
jgi:hypothetical protein